MTVRALRATAQRIPRTRAYAARRRAEGKSGREIRRCIKRAVARQLFKLLERCDHVGVEVVSIW